HRHRHLHSTRSRRATHDLLRWNHRIGLRRTSGGSGGVLDVSPLSEDPLHPSKILWRYLAQAELRNGRTSSKQVPDDDEPKFEPQSLELRASCDPNGNGYIGRIGPNRNRDLQERSHDLGWQDLRCQRSCNFDHDEDPSGGGSIDRDLQRRYVERQERVGGDHADNKPGFNQYGADVDSKSIEFRQIS